MKYFKHLTLGLFFVFIGCTQSGTTGVSSISPEKAHELQAAGKAIIVDVRERDEIAQGTVAGSEWLATSVIESDPQSLDRLLEGPAKGKEIIVYCRSGGRAGKAAEKLAAKGAKVSNMGAYQKWKDANLPIQKTSP